MRTNTVAILTGMIALTAIVLTFVSDKDTPGSEHSLTTTGSSSDEPETRPDVVAQSSRAVVASIESPQFESGLTGNNSSSQESAEAKEQSPFADNPQRNLDQTFASEAIDFDWAPGVEATIDATLRSNNTFAGFENVDIECRTTMCRVNVLHNEPLPPPAEGEWGIEFELSMLLRPVIDQNMPRLRGSTSYTRYPQSDDERMITGIYLIP